VFYDPMYAGFIDRDLRRTTTRSAAATRSASTVNRYRRVEFSGG
jgi:hypothetical protein